MYFFENRGENKLLIKDDKDTNLTLEKQMYQLANKRKQNSKTIVLN